MKRLRLRVSSLLKVSVLALIFSVFLQASLASAIGGIFISTQEELELIGVYVAGEGEEEGGTPSPLDGDYVVTQSFLVSAPITGDGNSYVNGAFTGTFDGGGNSISGLTKPLFDVIGVAYDTAVIINLDLVSDAGVSGNGALAKTLNLGSEIVNVLFTGDVTGTADVGGLVGISFGAITNSSATGVVTGDSYVGGLVGSQESGAITNSSANGAVDGTYAVGGLVGRSKSEITNSFANSAVDGTSAVGGLVGESTLTSTITNNSYATGTVVGTEYGAGGLVGLLAGTITDSSATVAVTGINNVGGLVGESSSTSNIDDSIAVGTIIGISGVGGLAGLSEGAIINSYATGAVTGTYDVGGLVGWSTPSGSITNSYASATSTVDGDFQVGGLVGSSDGVITNSYAAGTVEGSSLSNNVGGLVGYATGSIINSYATGDVTGLDYIGGLIGNLYIDLIDEDIISNSYASGDVTGLGADPAFVSRFVGYSNEIITDGDLPIGIVTVDNLSLGYGVVTVNGEEKETDLYAGVDEAPEILSIVNTSLGVGFDPAFLVEASINGGRPYLISLIDSYDVVEEDTEETPSYSLRSYYTQAARSLDKALTSLGFKSNFSSHPNLGFQALEQDQSNSPAVIQLFEVSEYQNSNIILSKEDGLQLSISSYYKEAVEIWTQGLTGEYLYLGLVEFDKDGKAILPALKFDTANTYQLLMIKAADKLSEKPNLEAKVGQITINVF